MAELIKTDVAIVGAGIIGLAIAFRLAADGREVVVVDPNEAGSGASYGNAGTLAPYACAPVGNPDVLRESAKPAAQSGQPSHHPAGRFARARSLAVAIRLAIDARPCAP